MSESQRGMVAANVANMRQGERTDVEPSANLQKVSQAEAAEMLNVSPRTVAAGRCDAAVAREGALSARRATGAPEWVRAGISGTVSGIRARQRKRAGPS